MHPITRITAIALLTAALAATATATGAANTTPYCLPTDWQCSNWTTCTDGTQTRDCTTATDCTTDNGFTPATERNCTTQPPHARFTVSHRPIVTGEPVTLNATHSRGDIKWYNWSTGHRGPLATTTFDTHGPTPVTLTVVTQDGRTDTTTIRIPVLRDASAIPDPPATTAAPTETAATVTGRLSKHGLYPALPVAIIAVLMLLYQYRRQDRDRL